MQLHWDIFCRVIDNYGDIGICWRLARQLVAEQDRRVRLWVDDLASLVPLCPTVDPTRDEQGVEGVKVRHWKEEVITERVADVVVEAFACDLPANYVQAMAEADRRPCWINLEYLTAEPWAADCHGMASPHPTLRLTKYFFFPGFVTNAGGLLREAKLLQARNRYWETQPVSTPLEISLFCYDSAPVGDLLDILAKMDRPSLVHVPPGKPLASVKRHLSGNGPWQYGNARIVPVPFMPLDDYDRLLWQCDINFVRGEDSFVRAQWAGKPFVWQIYRQDEDAHLVKLSAFLDTYCAGLDEALARSVRTMFAAWNGSEKDLASAWQGFVENRQLIAEASRNWCAHLASQDDLATKLVNFCASRV